MAIAKTDAKREYVPGEVAELGREMYYARFRDLVEPENKGKFIAIHVDSGDYAIAKSTAEATRALRKTHELDGRIYLRRIGEEPEYELASRILGIHSSYQ